MGQRETIIGIDAGATKTLCALATAEGEVLAVGAGGCGNFQASGVAGARHEIRASIDAAALAAGVSADAIGTAYYAIAGADREKDFRTIEKFLKEINPARAMFLENDTHAAVRGGTPDGVGIGLVAGTGTNAIGFNRRGERLRCGGMGRLLSDFGSAEDIAEAAVAAAQRGHDGRGEPTILYDMICRAVGIAALEDAAEFFFHDSYQGMDLGKYAPLVFQAATRGDKAAIAILERAGHAIATAALVIRRKLFAPDETVIVVFGGSVLQKGEDDRILKTVIADVRAEFPNTEFVKLDVDPVVGALLLALDRHHGRPRDDLRPRVMESYRRVREEAAS